tara:strand:- start:864 stop:1583 length:720 start_codon:yes stop_codon:yes gene_type:complete
MKKDLVTLISKTKRKRIKSFLRSPLAFYHRKNLTKLAILFETDKQGLHNYMSHYQDHFRSLRNRKINLLEVGVGGFEDPSIGGHSLRMWKAFFKRGFIYAIDIIEKRSLEEKRIKIFKGSQVDLDFFKNVINSMSTIDIIIDDGSHINEHVITTFNFLFPKLKSKGIYVIEDTQTAYWPKYGGSTRGNSESKTSVNYFKSLTDGLNYSEFKQKDYEPTYMDLNISSIHFYHNLIFIYKV